VQSVSVWMRSRVSLLRLSDLFEAGANWKTHFHDFPWKYYQGFGLG